MNVLRRTQPKPRLLTRFAALLAVGVVLGVLASTPASADEPVEVSGSYSFPSTNPCTGLETVTRYDYVFRQHDHDRLVVFHLARTGSTDDGYVAEHGLLTRVANDNIFRASFSDTFRSADGSAFKVQGFFVLPVHDGPEHEDHEHHPLAEGFSLRCIGQ